MRFASWIWGLPDRKDTLPGDVSKSRLLKIGKALTPFVTPALPLVFARLSNFSFLEGIPFAWRVSCGIASAVIPVSLFFLCRWREDMPATTPPKPLLILPVPQPDPPSQPPQWKYKFGPSDRNYLKWAIIGATVCSLLSVSYVIAGWKFLGPVHRVEDRKIVKKLEPGDFRAVAKSGDEIRVRVTLDCDHEYTFDEDLLLVVELTDEGKKHCTIERTRALKGGRPFLPAIEDNPSDPAYHQSQVLGIRKIDKAGVIETEIQLHPVDPSQKFAKNADVGGWIRVTVNEWGRTSAGK